MAKKRKTKLEQAASLKNTPETFLSIIREWPFDPESRLSAEDLEEQDMLTRFTPSATLASITGLKPLSKGAVGKKLLAYIKRSKLMDPKNKSIVIADAKLKLLIHGKSKIALDELAKIVVKNLTHVSSLEGVNFGPLKISLPLARVVGTAGSRKELMDKLFKYLDDHNLNDLKNKRIIADEKLRVVFGGKEHISSFDLYKFINEHLK